MAILDSVNEHVKCNCSTITITKEEYDELKASSMKLELLLEAIFGKADLTYCKTGLMFNNIEEIMPVLFPGECAAKFDFLKALHMAKLREADKLAKKQEEQGND